MKIQTKAFGEIEVDEKGVIDFPKGLMGFEGSTRFVLLSKEGEKPFCWLQSVEDPQLAFIMISPSDFHQGYKLAVSAEDLKSLELDGPDDAVVYAIVVVPQDPSKMTANLQGPVIINPDRQTPFQDVVTVMDICRDVSLTKVTLATSEDTRSRFLVLLNRLGIPP